MHPRDTALRLAAGLVVASGATAAARRRRHRRRDYRVFVLEYHDVTGEPREPPGAVSQERFRRHLGYLRRHARLAALGEAVARLREPGALDEDLVVLTLDDGYAGNYEWAWRVLQAQQAPAAIFLATGFLDGDELWFDVAARCLAAVRRTAGRLAPTLQEDLRAALGRWPVGTRTGAALEHLKHVPADRRDHLLARLRAVCPPLSPAAQPLRWEQVRDLRAAGIEIGAHTVSHPILSTLPAARQEEEIARSRDRIAEETGTTPAYLAYPNGAAGDFDADTVRIARAAGFAAACTTVRRSNRPGCDLFTLARLGVGAEPPFVLAARIAGAFDDEIRAAVRRTVAHLLPAVVRHRQAAHGGAARSPLGGAPRP